MEDGGISHYYYRHAADEGVETDNFARGHRHWNRQRGVSRDVGSIARIAAAALFGQSDTLDDKNP